MSKSVFSQRLRKSEKDLELYQALINNLWFIRDCSCNINTYFDISINQNQALSRVRTNVFSNSSGEYEVTKFNSKEIQQSLELTYKIFEIIDIKFEDEITDLKSNQAIGIVSSDLNYVNYSTTNRIHRAYLFLNIARSNSFLPLKISFLIGVLETLFTTDKTEVTHKVSERVSFYLSENLNKIKTFELIKECYNIRSGFVHGQKLSKKYDHKLLSIKSNELDNLIRILFNKILNFDSDIFLENDNNLNYYFKKLIFE